MSSRSGGESADSLQIHPDLQRDGAERSAEEFSWRFSTVLTSASRNHVSLGC